MAQLDPNIILSEQKIDPVNAFRSGLAARKEEMVNNALQLEQDQTQNLNNQYNEANGDISKMSGKNLSYAQGTKLNKDQLDLHTNKVAIASEMLANATPDNVNSIIDQINKQVGPEYGSSLGQLISKAGNDPQAIQAAINKAQMAAVPYVNKFEAQTKLQQAQMEIDAQVQQHRDMMANTNMNEALNRQATRENTLFSSGLTPDDPNVNVIQPNSGQPATQPSIGPATNTVIQGYGGMSPADQALAKDSAAQIGKPVTMTDTPISAPNPNQQNSLNPQLNVQPASAQSDPSKMVINGKSYHGLLNAQGLANLNAQAQQTGQFPTLPRNPVAMRAAADFYNNMGKTDYGVDASGKPVTANLDVIKQMIANKADIKATTQALGKVESQTANFAANEDALSKEVDNAKQLSNVVDRLGIKSFAELQQKIQTQTNDPDVIRLSRAVNAVTNSYAKLIGGGIVTDAGRADAQSQLAAAMDKIGFTAAADQMLTEGKLKVAGYNQEINDIKGSLSGNPQTSSSSQPADQSTQQYTTSGW